METLRDDLVQTLNKMVTGLKKAPCQKCGGKMLLDFDDKSGYFRNCFTCGRIEYINVSLASMHPSPVSGVSREGRHAILLSSK